MNDDQSLFIKNDIQYLLQLAKKNELDNAHISMKYALEAIHLAETHQLHYEHCLALIQLGDVKETLLETNDSRTTVLLKAISIAEQQNFSHLLIYAHSKLTSLLASQNDIHNATTHLELAKYHMSKEVMPSHELLLTVLYDEVNLRYRKGEVGSALLADCFRGAKLAAEIQHAALQSCFLQMLAQLSAKTGELSAAIKYTLQFIAIEEKRNYHMALFGAYIFLSDIYKKMQHYNEAEAAFDKATAYARMMGDVRSQIIAESRKANFLLNQNRYTEAAKICNALIRLHELNETPKIKHEVVSIMAQVAIAENQLAMAIQLLEEEIKCFTEDKVVLETITKKLYGWYAEAGDFSSAYQMLLENTRLKQEIYDKEKAKEYAELHTRYETKEREAQLREAQLRKSEAELKAIKSQMNPHFIFNALGSVSNLIEKGKIEEAKNSLQQFSLLMRGTLEQSLVDEVLIEDEVAFLESYLNTEKNILGDDFSYRITVSDTIDTTFEKIPSLILQPIVENALKHGLRTKTGDKTLSIDFSIEEKNENKLLKITIVDNGIGRKASAALNKNKKSHQSFATQGIAERIKIINNTSEFEKVHLQTIDLPEGTAVTVCVLTK